MSSPVVVGVIGAGMAGLTAARRLVALAKQFDSPAAARNISVCSSSESSAAGSTPPVATSQTRAPRRVVVVDKARGAGGRMATRRVAGSRPSDASEPETSESTSDVPAVGDTGAQFFTVRSTAMREAVDEWSKAGVARVWTERGFDSQSSDGHERWVGVPTMNNIPKYLFTQLVSESASVSPAVVSEFNFGARVIRLERFEHGSVDDASSSVFNRWRLHFEDPSRAPVEVDALIVSSPAPQTLDLLESSNLVSSFPTSLVESLRNIQFDPCLAVVLRLNKPTALSQKSPAAVQNFLDGVAGEPLSFIADNMEKGSSSVPCVTLHAGPIFSRQHYDNHDEAIVKLLSDAAKVHLGDVQIVGSYVHKWRFARPTKLCDERFLSAGARNVASDSLPLIVFCGDAFVQAAVEGAMLSGRSAADHVNEVLIESVIQ